MSKQKAEIKVTISRKEDAIDEIETIIELAGSDHDIMEVAEIAQRIQLFGESCMERILVQVLNENPKVISTPNRAVH